MGQVTILLPQLQKMRIIVERLRPLSDILALRANNCGKLQIAISTDAVKLETQWVGCANPSMSTWSPSYPKITLQDLRLSCFRTSPRRERTRARGCGKS
jgi:hypothetical protein